MTDNCGHADGIGSRFFAFNAGGGRRRRRANAEPTVEEPGAGSPAAEPGTVSLTTELPGEVTELRRSPEPRRLTRRAPEIFRAETFHHSAPRADKLQPAPAVRLPKSARAEAVVRLVHRLADAQTVFPQLGLNLADVTAPDSGTAVRVVHGYLETGAREEQVELEPDGYRLIRLDVSERIEAHVFDDIAPSGDVADGSSYTAYLVVNGELRALPAGSSFDSRKGIFYWRPAPGYLGIYDFLFVSPNGDQARRVRLEVVVR